MSLLVHPREIVATSDNPLLVAHPSWPRVDVDEVADILNGAAFRSEFFNKNGTGMPLLRIRDVGGDGSTDAHYDGEYEDRYIVRRGDFVIGMDGDFRIAPWDGPDALLNQRVCKVTVRDPQRYDSRFLFHVLQGYLDAIHEVTSSVTVKHLSSRTVAEIPVPDPPLDEQRRIVEAIETHLSHLDAGVESLQRAKARLRGLRLAVLAAEFGSVYGSAGTPIREMLATNIGGVWGDPPGMGEADVPVARITEFRADGTVDVASGTIRAITRRQLTSRRLQPGDLLLEKSGGGPRQPVGRVARVMSDYGDAVCGNFVQLVRPDPEVVEPGYLYWVLTWLYGSGVAARYQTASTNIRNLKTQDYLGLHLPLPSLSSQQAAIDRIEARLGVVEHTASEVRVIGRRSSGLRAAILAAAFSGRLAHNHQGAAA